MSSASQTTAKPEYWPIRIARSDGQGYQHLDNNALSDNDDQDVTQRERWEVIIAGHLQTQLGPKDDSKFRDRYFQVCYMLSLSRNAGTDIDMA